MSRKVVFWTAKFIIETRRFPSMCWITKLLSSEVSFSLDWYHIYECSLSISSINISRDLTQGWYPHSKRSPHTHTYPRALGFLQNLAVFFRPTWPVVWHPPPPLCNSSTGDVEAMLQSKCGSNHQAAQEVRRFMQRWSLELKCEERVKEELVADRCPMGFPLLFHRRTYCVIMNYH